MKKILLISGLAVAAMVSCTKNEVYVSENNDAQISFKPLSATQTKSTPITSYEDSTGSFNVYAWYQATDKSANFDPSKDTTLYMNNVTCSYASGDVDSGAGEGTWRPADKYFWPKNGKLTFSAYYPSNLGSVTVNAVNGIKIENYKISDATKQVDVMYSTRVFDKTSSTETDDNKIYDGVDIVFNHALAAASFVVKAAADYGTDAIKLYKIEIVNATSNGSFTEGYATGASTDAAHPAWEKATTPETANYTIFDKTVGESLTTATTQAGVDCIVLPQTFSDDIAIKVTYGIKHGTNYLEQTATFSLKNITPTSGNTTINGWEMGKWYKYTITFTLDEIYFAPSVSDWDNVIVDKIEVK